MSKMAPVRPERPVMYLVIPQTCGICSRVRSETVCAGAVMVYCHFFLVGDCHTGTKFGQWLSGKSLKLLRPDEFSRHKICQKCFATGALLQTLLGSPSYSSPSNPLAGFRPTSNKGREGRSWEGRGRERKGGMGRRKDHTGTSYSPFRAWSVVTQWPHNTGSRAYG